MTINPDILKAKINLAQVADVASEKANASKDSADEMLKYAEAAKMLAEGSGALN